MGLHVTFLVLELVVKIVGLDLCSQLFVPDSDRQKCCPGGVTSIAFDQICEKTFHMFKGKMQSCHI